MAERYVVIHSGSFQEREAVAVSRGSYDAGKIPALDDDGKLDQSLIRDDMQVAYSGTATFNSTDGVTINLPASISEVSSYSVMCVPLADSGFVGDVWVEKNDTSFTIYNSGSDNSTQFEYIVLVTK